MIPVRRQFVCTVKCWRVEVRTVLTRVGGRKTRPLDPLASTQENDAITIIIAATPCLLRNITAFRAFNVRNTR